MGSEMCIRDSSTTRSIYTRFVGSCDTHCAHVQAVVTDPAREHFHPALTFDSRYVCVQRVQACRHVAVDPFTTIRTALADKLIRICVG